jgi:phytoene dehydrogenase-like protein
MNGRADTIVIGGGLNGLVAAFYLARGGRRPLVLEALPEVGGTCVTGEIAPGHRVSALLHASGPLRPGILADLQLGRHGLVMLESPVRAFVPAADGRALVLHGDTARSTASIAEFSRRDAERFSGFDQAVTRIAGVLSGLLDMTPPDIDHPGFGDIVSLLRTGKQVRDLGRGDLYRVLRWLPMAVADLAAEWFESEPLRAALAARAILGQSAGPWSAGTGAVLFLRAAAAPGLLAPLVVPKGGMGALTRAVADAARAAGAEIRTGSAVQRIASHGGVVDGVVLAGGDSIDAPCVVSSIDPKATLLRLVDAAEIDPGFRHKVASIRMRGLTAKVNLVLGGLPAFTALQGRGDAAEALRGRILIGPEIDYLEHAYDASKYGAVAERPFLEATIPSLLDPSLAPEGRHVMSVMVQSAPYHLREGDWDARRSEIGDLAVKTLAEHAPGLPALVEHGEVVTPRDLETTHGLTEGHLFHGEEALDQVFTMRPILGWARYRTPIRGLWLCGSGTHPGGGPTGANGRNAAREILAGRGRS